MIHWFLLLVVMVSGVSVLFSQALPIMIDEQLNRPHHSRFEKTTTAMKPDSNTTLIGRWPNGPCYLSFVVGNYTYINNGGALEILDISNPASPVSLGQWISPLMMSDIFVLGNYAYVAAVSDGLRIIDVSNPAAPVEVGFFDTGDYAGSVYVSGSFAYVADGGDGLRIIDVSNPTAPVEVGFFDTGDRARDVYVSGNYAYVADLSDGLRIIDVSNPTGPVEVGFFDTGDWARGVYVLGQYAYVAAVSDGLRIIDVSNPAAPDIGDADVVLMDIGLPGMSGIDGVKYLHERYPNMAIVMCTVHDDDQNIFDALCAGAVGYLLKKTPPDELVKSLRDAANGGSPMTPNIARKVIGTFHQTIPFSKENSPDQLTPREQEVLEQLAEGNSYAAIAEVLGISLNGVRFHVRGIYEKLQVHSRSEAVAKGLKKRLLRPPR